MRLQFLTHLLNSVTALARPQRIIVLGSSSLLPSQPQLGDAGQALELSLDADLLVEPVDQGMADLLKEAVGHESEFEKKYGYYADIFHPIIAETLPAGWDSRLHSVAGYDNVFTLDPYDLALVKLTVGRTKDLELVQALLKHGILEPKRLQALYQQTPLGEHEAAIAGRNLATVLNDNNAP
jgi:hypothetical protein